MSMTKLSLGWPRLTTQRVASTWPSHDGRGSPDLSRLWFDQEQRTAHVPCIPSLLYTVRPETPPIVNGRVNHVEEE